MHWHFLVRRRPHSRQTTPPAATSKKSSSPASAAVSRESLETKRECDGVVDAITAEDVGKFPDKNLAEALQRVPGVSHQPRVRRRRARQRARHRARTSPARCSTATRIATADWFILEQLAATRSFNYLMLPAEIIGQVEVYKSPQADIEEGGIGGTIDVQHPQSARPRAVHDHICSRRRARTPSLRRVRSAGLGPVQLEERCGDASASWSPASTRSATSAATASRCSAIPTAASAVTTVLQCPSLIGSALFQQERVRTGGNFAVQFRPSDTLDINLTGLYSKFERRQHQPELPGLGLRALGGGGDADRTSTDQSDGHAVAGTHHVRRTAAPPAAPWCTTRSTASRPPRPATSTSTSTLRPSDDWTLHFKVGYTEAEGNTDAQPSSSSARPASFTYDLRGAHAAGAPSSTSIRPIRPTMVFDFGSLHQILNDDDETYVYVDFEQGARPGRAQVAQVRRQVSPITSASSMFNATTYGAFFAPLNARLNGGPCSSSFFAGGLTPGDFLENIAATGTLTSYWQVDRDRVEDVFFDATSRRPHPVYPPQNFSVDEKALRRLRDGQLEGDDWRGNVGVRVRAHRADIERQSDRRPEPGTIRQSVRRLHARSPSSAPTPTCCRA